jgi:hypothetical protein
MHPTRGDGVVVSASSVDKPWVPEELNEGFVKRLDGKCRFIPLRPRYRAVATLGTLGARRTSNRAGGAPRANELRGA